MSDARSRWIRIAATALLAAAALLPLGCSTMAPDDPGLRPASTLSMPSDTRPVPSPTPASPSPSQPQATRCLEVEEWHSGGGESIHISSLSDLHLAPFPVELPAYLPDGLVFEQAFCTQYADASSDLSISWRSNATVGGQGTQVKVIYNQSRLPIVTYLKTRLVNACGLTETTVRDHPGYTFWQPGSGTAVLIWQADDLKVSIWLAASDARPSESDPHSLDAILFRIAGSMEPASWSPTTAPSATPLPTIGTLRLVEPLIIDGEAGWIYASGQLDGRWKTVKLSSKDGTLSDAYDNTGKLALDPTSGRLFVDEGEAGIAVLDTGTGDLLSVATLPTVGPARASPQVDQSSGLLYAFRGSNVYTLDPVTLDVVHTAEMAVPTSVCGDQGEEAVINASFYDEATDRLYLLFVTYVCTPWVQQTIVACDANTLAEIGRYQTERTFQAVAYGGDFHGTTTSQLGRSVSWAWDGDEAWYETADAGRRLGGIVLDRRRGLIYEALDDQVWAWQPRSREVIWRADEALLSSGARLAAYDPVSDQLCFLLDGHLETRQAYTALGD